MKQILNTSILAAVGLALCASSAQAYTAGDLVLFFQKSGSANTVQLDLGLAKNFRQPAGNLINIANINTALSAEWGASWYNDTGLVWGAAGVRSSSANTTFVSFGDPNQTVYMSASRSPIGTVGTASSSPWIVNTADLSGVSGSIISQNNVVSGTTLTAPSGSALSLNNPFLTANQLDNAFSGTFAGGVGQFFTASSYGTLGGVAVEGALDLYRILATTGTGSTPAYVADGATPGNGAFEGTLVIDNSGNVSYLVTDVVAVPEPTTMGATLVLGLVAGTMRKRRRQVA
ncbi:MAG: PEP-CTERM sorting domain-containing protein [Verrucomicrobia bacterium]|nr:PEP-CTERM sorting domain-containing protein [Verrucomicrobiota bacterium]